MQERGRGAAVAVRWWCRWRGWLVLLLPLGGFFLVEYGIYYASLLRCGGWPMPPPSVLPGHPTDDGDLLHLLLLADTHLLGPHGHWLDRARREWQMERAFQSATHALAPDAVIVLGDVTDEGKWTTFRQWEDDVARFRRIFRHEATQLEVVVGNHDIGFHDHMASSRIRRFEAEFGDPNRLFYVKGYPFVMLNSMTFEDKCQLCQNAEAKLARIAEELATTKTEDHRKENRRPILLVHFPLYRSTQEHCIETDVTPELVAKLSEFKGDELQDGVLHYRNIPNKDVMNQKATELIMGALNPAFVFSGHNHYSCLYHHPNGVQEFTVSTFNWRNRVDPSFMLATLHLKRRTLQEDNWQREEEEQQTEQFVKGTDGEVVTFDPEPATLSQHESKAIPRWKTRSGTEQHAPSAREKAQETGTEMKRPPTEVEVEVYLRQCSLPSETTIIAIYVLAAICWVLSVLSICRDYYRSEYSPSRSAGSFWSSRKMLKMV